jgi:hypothetical protein
VVAVRASLGPYAGPALGWPPGWAGLWTRSHVAAPATLSFGPEGARTDRIGSE